MVGDGQGHRGAGDEASMESGSSHEVAPSFTHELTHHPAPFLAHHSRSHSHGYSQSQDYDHNYGGTMSSYHLPVTSQPGSSANLLNANPAAGSTSTPSLPPTNPVPTSTSKPIPRPGHGQQAPALEPRSSSFIYRRWRQGISFGSTRPRFSLSFNFSRSTSPKEKTQNQGPRLIQLPPLPAILFWAGFVAPWCWLIGGWIVVEGEGPRLPLWRMRLVDVDGKGGKGKGEKGKGKEKEKEKETDIEVQRARELLDRLEHIPPSPPPSAVTASKSMPSLSQYVQPSSTNAAGSRSTASLPLPLPPAVTATASASAYNTHLPSPIKIAFSSSPTLPLPPPPPPSLFLEPPPHSFLDMESQQGDHTGTESENMRWWRQWGPRESKERASDEKVVIVRLRTKGAEKWVLRCRRAAAVSGMLLCVAFVVAVVLAVKLR